MTEKPQPLRPPRPTPYMSRIPTRRPNDKAHLTLGHAKLAVGGKIDRYVGSYVNMAIFEWKDGEWELLYDIPKGTKVAPWKEESEKERAAKAKAARERAEIAEERRMREAAQKAYNAYVTDVEQHSIYTSESFILAFEAGYRFGISAKE